MSLVDWNLERKAARGAKKDGQGGPKERVKRRFDYTPTFCLFLLTAITMALCHSIAHVKCLPTREKIILITVEDK